MNLLAFLDVHPIGAEITLWVLGVATVAAGAAGAWRLWRTRHRPGQIDPITDLLIDAPKALGTLALLFAAFSFALEIDLQSFYALATEGKFLAATSHILFAGGAFAGVGFLASWVLESFVEEEE